MGKCIATKTQTTTTTVRNAGKSSKAKQTTPKTPAETFVLSSNTIETPEQAIDTSLPTLLMAAATAVERKGAKKPAPKKPAPKAAPAAKTTPAPKADGFTGKRAAIIRAMLALKATTPANGQTAAAIGDKAKLAAQDVKHYCYKDNDLVTGGYVVVGKLEGIPTLTYSLTAKGAKAKFA